MSTNQVRADGQLLFLGTAEAEILASIITTPGDSSVASFGNGSIRVYDLGRAAIGQISGYLDVGLGGSIGIWANIDLASVTDFAYFASTEPDPAMAVAVADNNGTVSAGVGSNWTRHWMTLYAPTKNASWNRAAFASVGLVFKVMPTGTVQYLDDAMWEISPLPNNVPSTFVPARSLDTWVSPTRLNHSTNPSFEVDLTDWIVAGGTITRVTTDHVSGAACLQAAGMAFGRTVSHTVKTLIPGHEYTVSIWVKATDGKDVGLQVNGARNATGIVTSTMTWLYGADGSAADPDWHRLWVSFTADAVTATLQVTSYGSTTFLLDAALIEEGNGLKNYFDGDSGSPDYVWELNGTVGKARSYYYRDKLNRHYALVKTLNDNVQLGLVVSDPIYANSASSTTTPYGSGPYGSGPYGG